MSWLKRHPLLGAGLVLGWLAVAADGWFLQQARQQAARAGAALEQKKQERDWLARQSPAPSAANEQAITQELLQSRRELAGLRAALQARDGEAAGLAPPAKPLDAYFAIAAFVEKSRALAARAQVLIKPDERFGFATHANEGPEPELLPALTEVGAGCIPFSPLAQGLLTNRYLAGIPSDSRAVKPLRRTWNRDHQAGQFRSERLDPHRENRHDQETSDRIDRWILAQGRGRSGQVLRQSQHPACDQPLRLHLSLGGRGTGNEPDRFSARSFPGQCYWLFHP